MKLVSYKTEGRDHIGLYINGHIYNLQTCDKRIPDTMLAFLQGGTEMMDIARKADEQVRSGVIKAKEEALYELMAPVPYPTSCRDGYAFRQHVAAARRNRGVEMIPEFDEYPIFYFTNHNAIQGPGDIECMPDHFDKLDFELEVAVAIGIGVGVPDCDVGPEAFVDPGCAQHPPTFVAAAVEHHLADP